jgi:hypothetical protein
MANPLNDKTTLPGSAIGAPAMALVNPYRNSLAIAWTGAEQAHLLNVGRSSAFAEFNKVTLNESSPYGPALAFGNHELSLAWTSADQSHSLNVISSGATMLIIA